MLSSPDAFWGPSGPLLRPWPPLALTSGVLGLIAVGATYRALHKLLEGYPLNIYTALGFGLSNFGPWLIAFEYGKRRLTSENRQTGVESKAALIAFVAAAVSVVLERLIWPRPRWTLSYVTWDFIQVLPGMISLTLALILLNRLSLRQRQLVKSSRVPHLEGDFLPVHPDDLDAVTAAGNYVELHHHGRTTLCRATMNEVEAILDPRSFVRVHRSTIVKRACIVRSQQEGRRIFVITCDGSRHKVGQAYQNSLQLSS